MPEWFDNLTINKTLRERNSDLYYNWLGMQDDIKKIFDFKE